MRFKYARKKPKYSGHYYFGMSEKEYQEYKKLLVSKTKRRKKLTFYNIYLFKILDEAVLDRHYKHFFKVAIKEEQQFKITLDELTTRDYEYLGKRNGDQSIDYVSYEKRSTSQYLQGVSADTDRQYSLRLLNRIFHIPTIAFPWRYYGNFGNTYRLLGAISRIYLHYNKRSAPPACTDNPRKINGAENIRRLHLDHNIYSYV